MKTAGSFLIGESEICSRLVDLMNEAVTDRFNIAEYYFQLLRKEIDTCIARKHKRIDQLWKNEYAGCVQNVDFNFDKIEYGFYVAISTSQSPLEFLRSLSDRTLKPYYDRMKVILGHHYKEPKLIDVGYSAMDIYDKHIKRIEGMSYILGFELVTFKSIAYRYPNPTLSLFNGKINNGEFVLEAAVRETIEEAGIDISEIIAPSIQRRFRQELNLDLPLIVEIDNVSRFYVVVVPNDSRIRIIEDIIVIE